MTLLIIKNYTISSELSTEVFSVSLQPIHEYHQVFRHHHEPCRIHIELWNVLFTNVFMQLYPNHLNCTVIGKLENKKIQQSLPLHAPRNLIIVYIMMLKHRVSLYLSLFSCNKLTNLYKTQSQHHQRSILIFTYQK